LCGKINKIWGWGGANPLQGNYAVTHTCSTLLVGPRPTIARSGLPAGREQYAVVGFGLQGKSSMQ
jgi:hypothetical protein